MFFFYFRYFYREKLVNLPRGHFNYYKKFGPAWFNSFDVYWIQTNKLTAKQSLHIYINLRKTFHITHYTTRQLLTYDDLENYFVFDLKGLETIKSSPIDR